MPGWPLMTFNIIDSNYEDLNVSIDFHRLIKAMDNNRLIIIIDYIDCLPMIYFHRLGTPGRSQNSETRSKSCFCQSLMEKRSSYLSMRQIVYDCFVLGLAVNNSMIFAKNIKARQCFLNYVAFTRHANQCCSLGLSLGSCEITVISLPGS